MKQLITSVFALLIAVSGTSQNDTRSTNAVNCAQKKIMDRVEAAVSMGGGLNFSNSRSTSNFTYIAPALRCKVSPKFILQAGLIHYNVTGSPFMTGDPLDNNQNANKNYSGNIIQLAGLYQMNERLTLSGSVTYQVNPLTANKQTKISTTSFGLDYKLNPHTTLSIQTNIIDSKNAYHNNSMYYYAPSGPGLRPQNATQQMFNVPNWYFPTKF